MLDEEQLHAIRSSPRGNEFHNRLAQGRPNNSTSWSLVVCAWRFLAFRLDAMALLAEITVALSIGTRMNLTHSYLTRVAVVVVYCETKS